MQSLRRRAAGLKRAVWQNSKCSGAGGGEQGTLQQLASIIHPGVVGRMGLWDGGVRDHWRQEKSNRSGKMEIIKILAGNWPLKEKTDTVCVGFVEPVLQHREEEPKGGHLIRTSCRKLNLEPREQKGQ